MKKDPRESGDLSLEMMAVLVVVAGAAGTAAGGGDSGMADVRAQLLRQILGSQSLQIDFAGSG